jgi:hypothetical protein
VKARRTIVLECDANDGGVLDAWAREQDPANAWMHFPFVSSDRVKVASDTTDLGAPA